MRMLISHSPTTVVHLALSAVDVADNLISPFLMMRKLRRGYVCSRTEARPRAARVYLSNVICLALRRRRRCLQPSRLQPRRRRLYLIRNGALNKSTNLQSLQQQTAKMRREFEQSLSHTNQSNSVDYTLPNTRTSTVPVSVFHDFEGQSICQINQSFNPNSHICKV